MCLVGDGRDRGRREPVPAEVVGFRDGRTLLMPLGEMHGIGPGTRVLATGAPFRVAGRRASCSGRVVDGLGRPIDGMRPRRTARRARSTDRRAAGRR